MTTVFIAGSINIKNLDPKVKERINNIVASDFDVVVGDAGGADTSIQEYLLSLERSKTTVFAAVQRRVTTLVNGPPKQSNPDIQRGRELFY